MEIDKTATSTCMVCFRRCELAPGETGWCKARRNDGGQVVPTEYGWVSGVTRAIRGYGSDPFMTFKPGATSLFLGGLRCSAGCTFCATTDVVHGPQRLPWVLGEPAWVDHRGVFYGFRGKLDPGVAVDAAIHQQCSQINFGINEPTVTAEWTIHVATLAKQRGFDVVMQSNGYTTPEVIRGAFGGLVDAVHIGVKGSADPAFTARYVRAPGAEVATLAALQAWQQTGAYLLVGDILAAPHQQTRAVFRESAARFYGWVAQTLGELTPLLICPMMRPVPFDNFTAEEVPMALPGQEGEVLDRLAEATELARAAGLRYAMQKTGDDQINCHACSGVLLRFKQRCGDGLAALGFPTSACAMAATFCPFWTHEQHATGGRCNHCGAEVPVVTLAAEQLRRERARVARVATAEAMTRTLGKSGRGT